MMAPKSKIHVNVVLWTILAIVIVLHIGFLWYLKVKVESATYSLKSADISYEERDKVSGISRALGSLEPQIDKVNSYFVDSDNAVSFINLLEGKARSVGLGIETTNVSVEENNIYGEELFISIETTGSWNANMTFVKMVELLPYNISIRSSRLEYGEVEEGSFWRNNMVLSVVKHK